MSSYQEILSAARLLNSTDRLRLANTLWENLPPSDWPLPDEQWTAEAQRRSAEYDAGRMSAAPWADVKDRARRSARLDG